MVGIDPGSEDQVTGLSHLLLEGSYLTGDDDGMVLLGKNLLSQYTVGGFFSDTLKDVHVGTKIRVMIGDIKKEVTVKGIVGSKVADVSNRIFFVDRELRNLLGRTDFRVNEIAVRIRPDATAESVRDVFLGNGFGDVAIVQTFRESEGTFLDQIRQTFTLLGGVIGGIALVVASITIFIVIFINAVTRRKYIGIMKGIGIAPLAIEISYVLQSVFYALAGSVLGLGILYGFIQPYFDMNPIDFPFADGLLLAPIEDTLLKMAILIFATIIAGYTPARMIISKNTLDSILGRTS
jgi:ABC-type lipoprotein release transport system permease subunit